MPTQSRFAKLRIGGLYKIIDPLYSSYKLEQILTMENTYITLKPDDVLLILEKMKPSQQFGPKIKVIDYNWRHEIWYRVLYGDVMGLWQFQKYRHLCYVEVKE